MVEPRSRKGDGPSGLRVDRVDLVPTDLGIVLVRVAGRWEGEPAPGSPVLWLGEQRFEVLPETSGAAERAASGPDVFRATFSVPAELRPALGAEMRLTVGEAKVELPPPRDTETGDVAPVSRNVVDHAALSERRARRAEQAEEASAQRAEEAERTLAELEGELAKLELRLDQVMDERADLQARLSDVTRDARDATQRAEAERRSREESVAEAVGRRDEAEAEAARLRGRARESGERARDLEREVEDLRRRVSEAEHAAEAAISARTRAEEVAGEAEAHAEALADRTDAEIAARIEVAEAAAAERIERAEAESAERVERAETEAAEQVAAERQAASWRRTRALGLERALAQDAKVAPHPAPKPAIEVDSVALSGLLQAEARAARARREPGDFGALREEARHAAAAVADASWTIAEARDAVGGAGDAVESERVLRGAIERERDALARELRGARQAAAQAESEATGLRAEIDRRTMVQERAERAIAELRTQVEQLRGLALRAARADEAESALREYSSAAGEALEEAERRIGEAREAATAMQDRLDEERSERERAEQALREELAGHVEAATARVRQDLEARILTLAGELQSEREARAAAESALAERPPPPAPIQAAGREPSLLHPLHEELTVRPREDRPEEAAPAPTAPWLPGALRRLAVADPWAAVRLGVQLLPAQALAVEKAVDYDLHVEAVGWKAVALRPGTGTVAALSEPRPRSQTDFRLEVDARALVELLGGGGTRDVMRAGNARVRGALLRRRALRAIPPAELDLAKLAEAGVWPDPGLTLGALALFVDPAWTEGEEFVVSLEVVGPRGGRWGVSAPGGMPVTVAPGTPQDPTATVQMPQAALHRLLAGQPGAAEGKAAIRGDVNAIARLVEWIERAQREAT